MGGEMGLDAFVFRNPKNLPFDVIAVGGSYTPETGEIYFPTPELDATHGDACIAIHHYIGNIAMVGFLREELADVLPPDSVVRSRVLYSGMHSGDWIAFSSFPQLAEELKTLEEWSGGKGSQHMRDFVSKMYELLETARREDSAIMF
jgi:hypothetical protein